MKKIIVLSILATLVITAGSAWACATCGSSSSTPEGKKVGTGVNAGPAGVKAEVKAAKTKPAAATVCLKCGQLKGTEVCCKEGQKKCAKCGLVKGSPGCCKIPKGAKEVKVCTSCGQFKGSSVCCRKGQEKCTACGLVKGSPGCCRLTK